MGLSFTPLANQIPVAGRIAFSGMLIVAAVLSLLNRATLLSKARAVLVGLLALALSAVFLVASRPSKEERLVADYYKLCDDPMWGNQPVNCFRRSQDVLTSHFADYAPDTWRAFEVFPEEQAINLKTLSLGGPAIDGQPVVSVGQVILTQDLGGLETVLQLRAPTRPAVRRLPPGPGLMQSDFAREVFTRFDGAESKGVKVPADSLVYLNVSVRPFFNAEPGELVIFKGLPIATGYVIQPHTGRTLPMTYVRGSSVEHVCATPTCAED